MRRLRWLTLGLALWTLAPARGNAAEAPPKALGTGPAYASLARLAVLHEGRIKPLDTLAREEVKQIFGRETIKLLDAARENVVAETWGPVAAIFDWSVRPEFWDDQPFLLVEYVPLKRLILADSIRARIEGVAGKSTTSEADRAALKALVEDREISASTVNSALARLSLPADDKATLATLAAELAEEHKWLTPNQVEESQITTEDGQRAPFRSWFGDVFQKKARADSSATGDIRLTEVEKRGYEVGIRLLHYQSLRDREVRRRTVEPILILPRPNNKAHLAFLAKTYEKARKSGSIDELSLLELDCAKALDTYWNELQIEDRAVPGRDAKFDERFMAWLRGSSAWIPLKAILDAKPEELAEAGYPAERMEAFRKAFKEMEQAEDAAPGAAAVARADALVMAARLLGEDVNATTYPTVAAIDRETYFNESNPFWLAPIYYGLATILLAVVLGFQGFEPTSFLGRFGKLLYVLGVVALVAGIGYEIVGFDLRVRISGWAPVTNMYETVIWVSLVAGVMGLVFEGIYRKAYAGLAGAGVALLGTVLAANVPLLDPDIKQLQPVLRSNYWLTIHVLTEVSSYGAFLMAALLGVIASLYYLTAVYRRTPGMLELAAPMIPGLPVAAVGILGRMASQGRFGDSWVTGDGVYYLFTILLGVGAMAVGVGLIAVLGEITNRLVFRSVLRQAAAASGRNELASAASGRTESTGAASLAMGAEGGGTAILTKPSVAEIRAMSAAAQRPPLDPRGQAMQSTAATIKPLANFIYRAMQVGVLLIAAGTILGGVWADYSWGRFWGWDPKEVWALITLLVYLVPLHGRFAGWINTFTLVFSSILCSMSVIMAWYGVNFVLGVGLHSYGFVEGGGQGVVTTACLAVLALPMAAGWRRHLGSSAARVAQA